MNHDISARSVRVLAKLMDKYSLDTDEIFKSLGVDVLELNNANTRIHSSTYFDLWEKAKNLIVDPLFSINVKNIWHPSDLNALGYAWMVSSTLRRSLERLQSFSKVASSLHTFKVKNTREGLEVIFGFTETASITEYQIDHVMAYVMEMCRVNTNSSLSPRLVCFTHNNKQFMSSYVNYYKSPVLFNSQQNKIVLNSDDVDRPLVNSTPELAHFNDISIINSIQRYAESDMIHKVKAVIDDQLHDGPSISSVSKALNFGERTLLRRLKDNNYTFKQVLDEVRIHKSRLLLMDNRYTIIDVSNELGFSDSSSFSRSFKNWMGCSPSEYRKLNLD